MLQTFIRVNKKNKNYKKTPESSTESTAPCGQAAKGIFCQPGKYE